VPPDAQQCPPDVEEIFEAYRIEKLGHAQRIVFEDHYLMSLNSRGRRSFRSGNEVLPIPSGNAVGPPSEPFHPQSHQPAAGRRQDTFSDPLLLLSLALV